MTHKKQMTQLMSVFVLAVFFASCQSDDKDHEKCNPDNASPSSEQVRVSIRGGSEQAYNYQVRDGKVFILDDIVLGSTDDVRADSSVVVGQLWTDGVVYYEIADDMPNPGRITYAMNEWNLVTGGRIRFEKRTTQANYVKFIHKENACWSYIGMDGGMQELNLGDKCSAGTTVHEIGHALGLWHEQSRNDRDSFVKILWCNIESGQKDNFSKTGDSGTDIGPYDYGSIMHYTASSFAKSFGLKTIESKTETPVPGARTDHTSAGDQAAIICMYDKTVPCPE